MANKTDALHGDKSAAEMTGDLPEQPKGNRPAYISRDIVIRTVDRTPKDVLSVKNALVAAESVYMPNRTQLYDLYKTLLLDGFLVGIMNKRINTVANKKIVYKVGEKPVKEMDKLLRSKEFRELKKEILLKNFWGLSGFQFEPGEQFKWRKIPRKHIKPKWRMITTEQTGTEGWKYDDYWNLWVLGDNEDLGLLLVAGYYVLLKRGAISDWAEYIEMFGLPIPVLKYTAHDMQAKAEGQKILDQTQKTVGMLIPDGMDYSITEPKQSGNSGDLQGKFRTMCNEELSVLILGATETTTSSESSGYAQSSTHADQQQEIIADDMQFLCDMLNDPDFANILRSYGYPVSDEGEFEFSQELDINFISKKQMIDIALINAGLPVGKDYLYETYGIPQPTETDMLASEVEEDEDDEPGTPPAKPKPKGKPGKGPRNTLREPTRWERMMDFFAHAPWMRG